MADSIIPEIGASGFFELKTPFDSLVIPNGRYVCQAIRKLSDYLANNEEPKDDIYLANGLTEADYEADLLLDMHVLSLQSDKGHWVYVPTNYVLRYPLTNGIPYRTVMLGVSLPALPADRDLSNIKTDIGNLIRDSLGIDCVIKTVETSRVVLVDKTIHDNSLLARAAVANGRVTDRSRYMSLLNDYQAALDKIAALELYISTH